MIGENHESVSTRGYDITKNVRAILSPRFISRGVILSALGAMTSCSSKTPSLYICSGRMEAIGAGIVFFGFRKSSSAMLFCGHLRYLQRLFQLARVKELVKELYYLFGAELDHAHSRAHQPLLNHRNALFQLGAVLLKLFVGKRARALLTAWEKAAEHAAAAVDERRVVRYDDKKVLGHNVGALGKVFDKRHVLADLDFHQLVELFGVAVLQERNVWPDVEVAALNGKLDRKLKRVEEVLKLADDCLLFVLRFERQVDARCHQEHAQGAVFEYDNTVAHLFDGHELLRCLRFYFRCVGHRF